MSLSLIHHKSLPSSSCLFYLHPSTSHPTHTLSKPFFFLHSKTPTSSLSLCASPSNVPHSSTTRIFLPHLQQQQEQTEDEEEEDIEVTEEEGHDPDDEVYEFFKIGNWVSSKEPQNEEKLYHEKNQHISWNLVTDTNNLDEERGMGLEDILLFLEEKEEMGYCENRKLPEAEGIVGEIVQLSRNLPQNLTLEEALDEYEGRVSEKECWEVLEILGEDQLLLRCLCFFQWMRLHEPSLVTPQACTVLFPVLGKGGMGDKLMDLFRNLPSSKEFRDVHVYNATISGLMSSGRYEDAWKVYESMETENIQPDHVTCSIMITVMRELGHSAKDAWEFFEKMNRKGVGWTEEVLGALMKSFCVEGLMRGALIIQSEMEKKGVSSNVNVYNTLMDAYCKSNHIEEAEGLFVEMKAKGIKPTTASFNILMHAYSRRMQPKIVEKLLAEMQDVGLKPNAESYTSLISAYGRQKKMSEMAADAFLKMKKVGIKPTSNSYTALIHAYSVSGLHEKAYMAFKNMQREGIKPSIETYTTLLDAFRRAGDAQTLMKIWRLMMSKKVEGTRATFNILVDGFAKQGLYMEARDVISQFGKLGLHPTVMTYNMLMNAYARGGQPSKLPQLLKEMAVLKLKPDSVTYSTMIFAFVRVKDFKRAVFYHKQMVKSRQMMDFSLYQKLHAIVDVKASAKNKDRSALLAMIESKMGVKVRGQKDEFWKYKKRHVRET
ncbi:pentatricopeptide repeat-containing protein At5g50280, chloroplastic-like [Abrus precatorius]|uniref:Pentatricopeptide repeat-containing protein At5g50280, chloroplastic-like n=1 Tax=Abrus precatorius TaxID=3816 RepID=A0A8B8LXJ4_ABRPR|nr:pentatricopeptide repeat-containing protein At5g50280, chloroplastic-like [Abrus precatorius]